MCSMWVPCVIDVQYVCAMYNGCAVCVCQDVFACLCAYIDRKICDIGPCYRLLHLECYFFLIKSYLLSRSLMPCLCEKRQPENPVRAHLLRNKQHIVKKKNHLGVFVNLFPMTSVYLFLNKHKRTYTHTHIHIHTIGWEVVSWEVSGEFMYKFLRRILELDMTKHSDYFVWKDTSDWGHVRHPKCQLEYSMHAPFCSRIKRISTWVQGGEDS